MLEGESYNLSHESLTLAMAKASYVVEVERGPRAVASTVTSLNQH